LTVASDRAASGTGFAVINQYWAANASRPQRGPPVRFSGTGARPDPLL